MAGLRVVALTKAYPLRGGGEKLALDRVDLAVAEGEFVCVLGPSGCGKTTLLNVLSGIDTSYRGQVVFTGAHGPEGPVVGRVFQDPRLLPWMTVRENLAFVLDRDRFPDRTARIEGWLQRVGLAGYEGYYPRQLSAGMQQRVAVARALLVEPELLLMDEPFSALDEITARRVRAELLQLWGERRTTVVFVTHNPLEAVYLADRVVVLSAGPGRVQGELDLTAALPRPRDPGDPRIWQLARRAVELLEGGR